MADLTPHPVDLAAIGARWDEWYDPNPPGNDTPLDAVDPNLWPDFDTGDESLSHYIVRQDMPGLMREVRLLRDALAAEKADHAETAAILRRAVAAREEAEAMHAASAQSARDFWQRVESADARVTELEAGIERAVEAIRSGKQWDAEDTLSALTEKRT